MSISWDGNRVAVEPMIGAAVKVEVFCFTDSRVSHGVFSSYVFSISTGL
jgi:hypothetical protein